MTSWAFACLGALFWMLAGAAIALVAIGLRPERESREGLADHAWKLGRPCWMVESGDLSKFRVVAVSHRGAVAIRRWDDESGKHARWIRADQVESGVIAFDVD